MISNLLNFWVIYNQRDRIHFKSTFAAVGLERRPPTKNICLIIIAVAWKLFQEFFYHYFDHYEIVWLLNNDLYKSKNFRYLYSLERWKAKSEKSINTYELNKFQGFKVYIELHSCEKGTIFLSEINGNKRLLNY